MIHTDGTPTIAHRSARVDHLPDVLITREGSLFLVAGTSREGRRWLDENTDVEAQRWGNAVVVEHRYVEELFNGMVDDGLVVR
jgi:hypothetical protein